MGESTNRYFSHKFNIAGAAQPATAQPATAQPATTQPATAQPAWKEAALSRYQHKTPSVGGYTPSAAELENISLRAQLAALQNQPNNSVQPTLPNSATASQNQLNSNTQQPLNTEQIIAALKAMGRSDVAERYDSSELQDMIAIQQAALSLAGGSQNTSDPSIIEEKIATHINQVEMQKNKEAIREYLNAQISDLDNPISMHEQIWSDPEFQKWAAAERNGNPQADMSVIASSTSLTDIKRCTGNLKQAFIDFLNYKNAGTTTAEAVSTEPANATVGLVNGTSPRPTATNPQDMFGRILSKDWKNIRGANTSKQGVNHEY